MGAPNNLDVYRTCIHVCMATFILHDCIVFTGILVSVKNLRVLCYECRPREASKDPFYFQCHRYLGLFYLYI